MAVMGLHWGTLASSGCSRQGFLSSCGVWASQGSGFSGHGAQALGYVGSAAVVHRLIRPGACGILVPRPGIEPMSPALAGGFLTPGPPRKSH